MTDKYNDYRDFAGKWYVFNGQNATTGTPNELTGRMSYYGEFIYCGSREEAIKKAEELDNGYAQDIVVAGTARSLRKYALGWPVDSYLENLKMIEYVVA